MAFSQSPHPQVCFVVSAHRVVQHKEKNKMSAENVGIVFGPTLLREANDQTIMDNLYLLQYQKKVVEIMVENPDIIFDK